MASEQSAVAGHQASWTDGGKSSRVWQPSAAGHGWIFGLEWTATLGQRSRRWLFTQLRQQNVRWYASTGMQGELIGISREPGSEQAISSLAAAAVGYAQSRPDGSYLLCLAIDPSRQWVVGVHRGKLLSHTDTWLEPEAVGALQQVLAQRFADLVIETVHWSNPGDDPPAALAFLQQAPVHQARFERLRPTLATRANALLLLGTLICLHGAAWMCQSLDWWPADDWQAAGQLGDEQRTVQGAAHVPVVEVHDLAALMSLLQGLQQLPVNPARWLLHGVQCQMTSEMAHCSAAYQRHQNNTDNEALVPLVPANWHLKPVAMDETKLESHIRMGTRVINLPSSQASGAWLVTLQRQTAITPELSVGSWRDQAVVPSHGRVRTREITLRLPVRQWAVLRDWPLPVYWQSVRLELVPNATVDEHHGYLMFHLKGELRAIEHSTP